jgi:hypothetical protein
MPCLDQWRRGGVHRPTELLDVAAQVVRNLSYVLGLRGLNTPGHIRVYKGDHGVDLLDDLDEELERVAGEQALGDAGRVVVPERSSACGSVGNVLTRHPQLRVRTSGVEGNWGEGPPAGGPSERRPTTSA